MPLLVQRSSKPPTTLWQAQYPAAAIALAAARLLLPERQMKKKVVI